MKPFAIGAENYEQKIFNNIWITYAFRQINSIYMGAYRVFLKFTSDS